MLFAAVHESACGPKQIQIAWANVRFRGKSGLREAYRHAGLYVGRILRMFLLLETERLRRDMKPSRRVFSLRRGTNRRGPTYTNIWGWGMSPGEVIACRLYAVYCVEIAQEFADLGRKAALLSMAQAWIALADQAEKAGRAMRGDPHPSDEP